MTESRVRSRERLFAASIVRRQELVTDRATKERAYDQAEKVMYAALERGLSFKLTMGNIVTLCPPLTVTAEEMDHAFEVLEECIEQASQ